MLMEERPILVVVTEPSARRRTPLGWQAALAGWFIVVGLVSASLLARHVVPLPRPVQLEVLRAALAAHRPAGAVAPGALGVVHVLYAECRCSRLVAEHLASKPRPPGVTEHVVLVGRDDGLVRALASRGFSTEVISVEQLAAWGIEAAPILVVLAPSGEVRYAGGYTAHKQALFPRDREIVASLRAGTDVAPLPIFGCAVSAELERTINPLGLPR
jgi:hypothetical protein